MAEMFDIVIIGGGPAGVSAGIYARRAGMKTLVIDGGNSALNKAVKIQNYYGVESMSGTELIEKGIEQYTKLGGEFLSGEAVGIKQEFETSKFLVRTKDKEFICKAVILCVGGGKKKDFEGLEKYEGTNVSYCAICDGFFYRDREVAVIGDGDFAMAECVELSHVAKKVYLLTNGTQNVKETHNNVETKTQKITSFEGKDKVESIIFEDGSKLDIDGVFVAIGTMSGFDIAKRLGILMNNDCVLVDRNFMTNIAGVFAGGDAIGGLLQVAKAVSDGAQAGLEATRYIKIREYNEQGK